MKRPGFGRRCRKTFGTKRSPTGPLPDARSAVTASAPQIATVNAGAKRDISGRSINARF